MWQELSTEIKKNFFLFLPSHPHKCGSSALFIGVSRVRVSVRVELLPSHLPSHFRHRKVSCQGFYLQNLTKVPEKYSYLVPTVQHRYTNSIAMPDYQYSYAGLSVYPCCTVSIPMLHLWCKGAALLLALLFESLYSGFSGGLRASFLHSKLLIRFAALRSVSLRLQSLNQKNAHGISRIFFGVFSRIRFLIFSF